MAMNQLTIPGIDDALRQRIEQVALEEGTSLGEAALLLMRRGAGISTSKGRGGVIGHSLDAFIGTWSEEEERELLEAIEIFE